MEFPKAGSGPNRKQIIDALRNTAQSASNMVAENASMPVDALAWALRKMGVPVGDKPVMGSDWMREKGLTAPVQEGASKVVGDTIGMISPMGFTKQGAQAIVEGAGKLKGLPVGMSIKDVSGPQSQALMLAQQRAALPVEQGGLGLAVGNTPAERAAAMGFEDGWAHGSPKNDISMLSPSNTGAEGPGAYATNYLPEAATYAGQRGSATSYPLMVNKSKTLNTGAKNPYEVLSADGDAELLAKLAAQGKNSIVKTQDKTAQWLIDAGGLDMPSREHYVSMVPDNFRSRFAAFDPFRKTAATAALMGVAAPDLLAQERDNGNR
jgi:hypothetical protein